MRVIHLWSQALLDSARPVDVEAGDPEGDSFDGCNPPRRSVELPYLCAPELAPSRNSSPRANYLNSASPGSAGCARQAFAWSWRGTLR